MVTTPVGTPVIVKWPEASVTVDSMVPTMVTVMPPRAAVDETDVAEAPDVGFTVPLIVAVLEGAIGLSPPQRMRAEPVRMIRPSVASLRVLVMNLSWREADESAALLRNAT
jgi:hypothetical protein